MADRHGTGSPGVMKQSRHRPDADDPAELERLRARVRSLEAQLDGSKAPGRPAKPRQVAPGWMKAALAGLGGLVVLMTLPTMLTIRRWIRWWRL